MLDESLKGWKMFFKNIYLLIQNLFKKAKKNAQCKIKTN
jgi:hypothetical protein